MEPGIPDVRATIVALRRAGPLGRAAEVVERVASQPVTEPARWFSIVQLLTEAGQLDRASSLLAALARGDHPEALDRRRIGGDPVRRIGAARRRLARARERAAAATRGPAAASRRRRGPGRRAGARRRRRRRRALGFAADVTRRSVRNAVLGAVLGGAAACDLAVVGLEHRPVGAVRRPGRAGHHPRRPQPGSHSGTRCLRRGGRDPPGRLAAAARRDDGRPGRAAPDGLRLRLAGGHRAGAALGVAATGGSGCPAGQRCRAGTGERGQAGSRCRPAPAARGPGAGRP